jgi:hypothetical protein
MILCKARSKNLQVGPELAQVSKAMRAANPQDGGCGGPSPYILTDTPKIGGIAFA